MTTRPQPRKPDALDLAETLEDASHEIFASATAMFKPRATAFDIDMAVISAKEAALRVLAAIDAYEGRT